MPLIVRRKAAELGAEGARWLAALPTVIAELERRWDVTIGPPLDGGSEAYVARAGPDAVVKIGLPTPGFAAELRTLTAARGRGYVRLLASAPDLNAMRLEALGPSMARLGLPVERQITLLCRTLREAWKLPPPAERTSDKAARLARLVTGLWHDLDRPCPEPVVERALACAEGRARADRLVVVHGDPHPGNTLRVREARPGAESGFVFVDPDGFPCDPAYDLGVVLRDWCPQLLAAPELARRYCRLMAELTGVDEEAIWEWGFLERVSTGLYLLSLGGDGRPFLTTAERLLGR